LSSLVRASPPPYSITCKQPRAPPPHCASPPYLKMRSRAISPPTLHRLRLLITPCQQMALFPGLLGSESVTTRTANQFPRPFLLFEILPGISSMINAFLFRHRNHVSLFLLTIPPAKHPFLFLAEPCSPAISMV